MDQAPVVHVQTRGFFGSSETLNIEEREFDYTTPDGQDRKLFLVVRLSESNIIIS